MSNNPVKHELIKQYLRSILDISVSPTLPNLAVCRTHVTYEPSKMAKLTMSFRSSVDRAPARCLGGHGSVGDTDFFFIPRSRHDEQYIFLRSSS